MNDEEFLLDQRFSMKLSTVMMDRLREVTKRTGTPIAEYIRRLIAENLKNN